MNDESLVIRPHEFPDDLLLPQNSDELAKFMDEPLTAIAEAVTGAMAKGPKSWMVLGGHFVQAILKGKEFQQVSQEIKELRDAGRIRDDFAAEKYGFKSWVELLKIIDDEAPDEDKLDALKAMFYSVNKINVEDRERILNYQLFQTAKRLSSAELLLIRAVFHVYQKKVFTAGSTGYLRTWAAQVAADVGHGSPELVIRDQYPLEREGLISARVDVGAAPYVQQEQRVLLTDARITPLGIRFCENIQTYHQIKQPN